MAENIGNLAEGLTIKELLAVLEQKLETGQDEEEVRAATQGWEDEVKETFRKTEFFEQHKGFSRIMDRLSKRQQSVQAVNVLPSEILCKIFEQLLDETPRYFPPPSEDEMVGYNAWILEATQVCRRWRDVALNTPSLWRYIILGRDVKCPGALGKIYIERSNPLKFELNYAFDANILDKPERLVVLKELYQLILTNRDRIQALHLSGTRENPLIQLLDQDLPAVQSVHSKSSLGYLPPFRGTADWPDADGQIAPLAFVKGTSLFGQSPSPVKRLSLSGFDVRPPAIFHQLTHLSLLRWSGSHTSMSDFLDLLASCPLLQYLYLQGDPYSDIRGAQRTSTKYSFRSIPLLHLKHLELRMPFSRFLTAEFLRYLRLPEDVTITWPPTTTGSILTRPPAITQLPAGSLCDVVTSVVFRDSAIDAFTLKQSTLTVEIGYHLEDKALFMIATLPDFFRNIKSIIFAEADYALPPPVEEDPTWIFDVPLRVLFDGYFSLETLELRCGTRSAKAFINDYIGDHKNQRDIVETLPKLSSIKFVISQENNFEELEAEVREKYSGNTLFSVTVERDHQPWLQADRARRVIFDSIYRDVF